MGTENVYWGLPIVTYLFIIGITAGSFIVGSLAKVFGIKQYEPLTKISLLVTLAFILFAPIGPLADAAQPERWSELFLRPHIPASPLGLFTLIWGMYLIVVIIETYIVYRVPNIRFAQLHSGWRRTLYRVLSLVSTNRSDKSLQRDDLWSMILSVIGLFLSLAFVSYDAFMLHSMKGHPLWANPVIIPMFITSAIVAGVAAVTIVYVFLNRYLSESRSVDLNIGDGLIRLLMWMLFADLLLDVVNMLGAIPHVYVGASIADGWHIFLGGPLTWTYWLGQIGMLTLALVLTWFPRVRQSIKLISLTSLIALFGVYMMRYNIVIGPQMQPKISQGLISYAPVVFGAGSWQVVFGLFMLPLFVLAVLSMVLPWDDHIFSIRIAVANEKRQPDQNNFRELT